MSIRTGFDWVTRVVSGFDFESRCWERRQHTDEEGTFDYLGFIGPRACYRFESPREFTGIYIDEFEGQRFLEGVAPSAQYTPTDKVWLHFDEKSDLGTLTSIKAESRLTRIWEIEFDGEKAIRTVGGGFGHMGASDDLILVNRVMSERLLFEQEGYLPDTVLVR